MSLQVWLPLNGDLRNQGLSKISVTNNGATINNNGKIGKCYSFGTAASDLTLPASSMTGFTTEASISFWIKILSWNTSYATFFQAGPASTAWTAYRFGILRNNANSNLCFTISSSSSASNANYTTSNLELNTWYHLSFCYKTGHCLIYINGTLYKDYTTTIVPDFTGITTIKIGRCTNGSSYQTNCLLNDFRIYNHCLSEKEVKEIAKGLVLHYQLNNNGMGRENLLTGTSNFNGWYLNTRWSKTGKIATYSAGSKAWNDLDSPTIAWSNVQNKDITVSIDIRSDDFNYTDGSGFSVCLVRKASGPEANNYSTRRLECTPIYLTKNQITTNWKRYSGIVKNITDASFTNTYNGGGGDWLGIYIWNYTDKSVQIKNIKLEIGDSATSWIPHISDTNINDFIINPLKIYDSSGYSRNGNITGNIITSLLSRKYSQANQLIDSASSIAIGNLANFITDGIFSFNIWFKKVTGEWSSKSWETILGGPSGFELEAKMSSNNTNYIHPYSWGGGSTGTPNSYSFQYSLDEWHMLTMVRTTTESKFYLDGELKVTGSAGSIPSGNYFLGAWSTATGQNYRGHFSDCCIYATALSVDDILELYKISKNVSGTTVTARDLE